MKGKSLITIIVPVYNVENYVRDCIESILAQSYSDLEIILVDDGSSDNSGVICDEFAEKDSRVTVIHKENKGLSSARNTGIKKASGNYVMMIDSDDWIDPDYVKELYKAIETDNKVMFVNSQPLFCYENGESRLNQRLREKFTVNGKELLHAILSETSNHYIHTKLFRKEVFDYVRFKEGRLDEDTLFTYELCRAIEDIGGRMVEIPLAAYHYRQRQTSICHDNSIELRIHRLDNLNNIKQDLTTIYPDIVPLVDRLYIRSLKWLISDMIRTNTHGALFRSYLTKLRAITTYDAKLYLTRFHYYDFILMKHLPVILVPISSKMMSLIKRVRG